MGTPPNQMDSQGNTPLHIAVAEGTISCVKELLSANSDSSAKPIVDVNVSNDHSLTPILLAIRGKKFDIVKMLFDGGVKTRLRDPKNGNNVLHLAVEMNWFDLVHYILQKRYVNVNEKNSSDFTALDLAIAQQPKSSEVVKLLLKFNALATVDPDEEDKPVTIPSSTTKCMTPIATNMELPVAQVEPSIIVVGVQMPMSDVMVIQNTVSTNYYFCERFLIVAKVRF